MEALLIPLLYLPSRSLMPTTLVWLRNDLRLTDHAALVHAAERGCVVPVFVWAPDEEGDWSPGGAHRWWLRESLLALDASLREHGSQLTLRSGPSSEALLDIASSTGADRVVWQTRIAPHLRQRDARVRDELAEAGLDTRQFAGRILHDPEDIQTGSGGPYKVFTPFWRKFQNRMDVDAPRDIPELANTAPETWPNSATVDDFDLSPVQQDGVDWADGMREAWTPGEPGALARLDAFLSDSLIDYDDKRNVPGDSGTSWLSPHLHWGEISPRTIWTRTNAWVQNGAMREAADKFLSEIAWREFSYHVLHHFPETPTKPLKEKYAAFPWEDDEDGFEVWTRGQTGYPIVDAGMRQLWATGWMHNRVRMIVASFLTKDLLVPWQDGARWFWDTLCGADLANNTMGWQWAAGCGADAQPFFRIFNPVSQGETHDSDGAYVRKWVTELAELPDTWIHKPWEAPADVLEKAGVKLGVTYPRPRIDHKEARERALAALKLLNR
ncbi:MAG: deoxyribodipyrimidine photo-lyase [Rubricoccaceae bacterium]